jgi:hypothetical protein
MKVASSPQERKYRHTGLGQNSARNLNQSAYRGVHSCADINETIYQDARTKIVGVVVEGNSEHKAGNEKVEGGEAQKCHKLGRSGGFESQPLLAHIQLLRPLTLTLPIPCPHLLFLS